MPGTMRPASSIRARAVKMLPTVAIHASGCIRRRAATASSAVVTSASAAPAAAGPRSLNFDAASKRSGKAMISAEKPWTPALSAWPARAERSATAIQVAA